jgi:hypothetical protein
MERELADTSNEEKLSDGLLRRCLGLGGEALVLCEGKEGVIDLSLCRSRWWQP